MFSLLYLLPPPFLLVLASLAQIPPSYFSAKNNIFNLFFVKVLWLWMTGAFIVLKPSAASITRYSILTAYWILFTQWCFGPPIIDRNFVITGGQCQGYNALSQLECRTAGRRWEGGHDISGHVFLLSLSSISLWLEISAQRHAAAVRRKAQQLKGEISSEGWPTGTKFALGVSILSMWMLMMTAAYFHTWFEKLTGLLVAYAGIGLAYVVPELVGLHESYLE